MSYMACILLRTDLGISPTLLQNVGYGVEVQNNRIVAMDRVVVLVVVTQVRWRSSFHRGQCGAFCCVCTASCNRQRADQGAKWQSPHETRALGNLHPATVEKRQSSQMGYHSKSTRTNASYMIFVNFTNCHPELLTTTRRWYKANLDGKS